MTGEGDGFMSVAALIPYRLEKGFKTVEIHVNARRSTNGEGGVVYQFLGLILVILLI